jgi:hypothetical protein
MSGDEVLVIVIAIVAGPLAWAYWLFRMVRIAGPARKGAAIRALTVTLLACSALIFAVLTQFASFDVVAAPVYQFMYVVVGLAWLRVVASTFVYFGLSARDDAVERGNDAALTAVAGALIAVTLCYAGGNIGDGPGWWVVLFSAALATGALLTAWAALNYVAPVADTVTIDRDAPAGIRLAAFLIALGLVFGRGVAGDWLSATRTIEDFAVALPPAAVILVLAVVIERIGQATPERPRAPMFALGVLPSLAYLAIAIASVITMGWPV